MIKFFNRHKRGDMSEKKVLPLGVHRYNNNKYIKYMGTFNKNEYPLQMEYPSVMNYNVEEGYVYYCFTVDDIEYVMITDSTGLDHSVSAYKRTCNNELKRIGALFYYIEPRNKNIAIRSYVVCNDYARQGIGGNILRVILRAENDLLKKNNIYVHACAGGSGSKHLNQKELEHHYERYGIVLCSECYSGAYKGEPPKDEVKNNLMNQINEALNL